MDKRADKLVRELGARVEAMWAARNYDDDAMPEVAMRVLEEARPRERSDALSLARWFGAQRPMPPQLDATGTFGQPPLTLFFGGRFVVDLYFWLDGTTAVHQHDFHGAFLVLEGSSVHSVFQWKRQRRYNSGFEIGALERTRLELLEAGDLRPILPAGKFIHSLFHLQHPSATLLIRNLSPSTVPSQMYFHPPGVAIDSRKDLFELRRKLALVDTLMEVDRVGARQLARRLVEDPDPHVSFVAIRHLRAKLGRLERLRPLLKIAAARHGAPFARATRAAIEEELRQGRVVAQRARVKDEALRFFLAALLNCRERRSIDALLKQRFRVRDTTPLILQWIRALAGKGRGRNEGALGFDLGETELGVLKRMLAGQSLEAIERGLARTYGRQQVEANAGVLKDLVEAFRGSIFTPLFL